MIRQNRAPHDPGRLARRISRQTRWWTRKEGAVELVDLPALLVDVLPRPDADGVVPGEDEGRHDDPNQHGEREVVQHGGDAGHQHHDEHIRGRHPAEGAQGGPFEGADGDHDHEAGQGGHRELLDERRPEEDEDEQHDGGHNAAEAGPGAGADVDEALADHGAATHAAEQTAEDVGRALGDAFAVALSTGLGDLVDDVEREQALHEADARHDGRVGRDEEQGIQGEGDFWNVERGEAALDAGEVADGLGVDAEGGDDAEDDEDGCEAARNGLGQARQEGDDGHGDEDEAPKTARSVPASQWPSSVWNCAIWLPQ